jgi:hypothetical protein
MRLLVVMRAPSYFRFVEAILQEVLRRGGSVGIITTEVGELKAWADGLPPERATLYQAHVSDSWAGELRRLSRELRSYLHWVGLRAQPEFLLDRWLTYLPRVVRGPLRLARHPSIAWLGTGPLLRLLAWLEQVAQPAPAILDQIRTIQPDLVLVTPLLYPNAWEIDYLKACRALHWPHAALVASWDNLTSKGIFHVAADEVLVWNEVQAEEARRYHALPAATVTPVGAPVFDWLFESERLDSRGDFCREIGLDPERPYVVYAVSSTIQHGDETEIVRRLQRQLAELAPGRVQVLVRPHPRNRAGWQAFEQPGIHVAFPADPGRPAAVKRDLMNTVHHAAAIVGLNTSVFLEAAILDRPGITLLYRDSRNASLRKHTEFPHFQYLLDGGFLEVAEDERACAERIVRLLNGQDPRRDARRYFVQRFIRPHGLHTPASQVAVNLFERLAAAGPAPRVAAHWPEASNLSETRRAAG